MTTIHLQKVGDQALLPICDLEQLLHLARKSDAVLVEQTDLQPSTRDFMLLADKGGSFDFWNESGEDIYSGNEGEPLA